MRKGIIMNADKELIYTLCECILNLLNGNINISDEKFNQLKSYKHSLVVIAVAMFQHFSLVV
jgi:hypothetical protein